MKVRIPAGLLLLAASMRPADYYEPSGRPREARARVHERTLTTRESGTLQEVPAGEAKGFGLAVLLADPDPSDSSPSDLGRVALPPPAPRFPSRRMNPGPPVGGATGPVRTMTPQVRGPGRRLLRCY
jgi:hypothetical protein